MTDPVREGVRRSVLFGVSAMVLAGVFGALASTALAYRLAITAEKSAMIYHASGRYYSAAPVDEPRGAPLKCFVADVSTVVKGNRWGAWTFSSYADHHLRQCRTADGVVTEHKIGQRWYVLWESSDSFPPTDQKRIGSHTYLGVPRAIAKDLLAGLR